ncbi:MAG: hypothetical protein JWM80_1122 [Cyanobacteria bacterium RYN_339]|nr:hypothetical protein [Cyanobacteria bacterium RYN_339]
MNSFPPIPPLDAKQVKALVRMIRVLRYDHPAWGDDAVAEEFETVQRWLASQERPAPFLEWLETPRWRAGFDRAAALAGRVTEQRQREKASRQRWKDVVRDKQPSTAAQQRYVTRLARQAGEPLELPPADMSKLAASRAIQRLKASAPPTS